VRAVVQRVKQATVIVEGNEVGRIDKGLLVFLGVGQEDTHKDISYMVSKIIHLRIFEDSEGKMNLSLLDSNGEMLVVSQFTLFGDCRKGRRPSFSQAALPQKARDSYNEFIKEVHKLGIRVASGVFQAMMEVSLINDGPVTLLLDSKK
jgi:D-tyrosyl-tRNA(Tyr) deacylase